MTDRTGREAGKDGRPVGVALEPTAEEYLEEVFERAFEREVEQEERVFNSLPFFVAALALTINVLGYVASQLPSFELNPYSVVTYALMLVAGFLLTAVLWFLFVGVRQRVFRLPPRESEVLEWADELKVFYSSKYLRGQNLQNAVVRDLRKRAIEELAQSTEHNRDQNIRRVQARTQGILLIVAQLAIAFVMVAIIFVHDHVFAASKQTSATHAATSRPTVSQVVSGNAPTGAQATAAERTKRCAGGKNLGCEAAGPSGTEMTEKTPTTPAPQSQPQTQGQPPAQRPAPPAPQFLKKNDDGKGLQKR